MLRAIVRTSPTIRSAVIIAASVALLLPLPARCLSCSVSVGEADCTRCQATHSKTAQPAHRSCCEHRTSARGTAASTAGCPNHVQSKTCGCQLQVPDRTYVTTDRATTPIDLVAILPATQSAPTADLFHAACSTVADNNLPPPVPHRILHCSWII